MEEPTRVVVRRSAITVLSLGWAGQRLCGTRARVDDLADGRINPACSMQLGARVFSCTGLLHFADHTPPRDEVRGHLHLTPNELPVLPQSSTRKLSVQISVLSAASAQRRAKQYPHPMPPGGARDRPPFLLTGTRTKPKLSVAGSNKYSEHEVRLTLIEVTSPKQVS